MPDSRKRRVRLRGSKIAPLSAAAGVAFGGAVHAQSAPVAEDDEFNAVKRDVPQVLGNVFDNDIADNPVRISDSSIDQDGSYVLSRGGRLFYVELFSNDCAATSDQFEYTLRDDSNLEASADVQITLLPPVQADMYQVEAGQILAEDVQFNDPMPIDPINVVDQLEITDFFAAGFGTVQQTKPGVVNETGQFTYEPDAGFSGNDSFVYFTPDSDTGCNWNTEVNILVVPVANSDAASTPGGEQVCAIDVLANDLGTDLDVIGVTQPAGGTVSISGDDTLCFSPDPGFLGQATFGYTIEDAAGTQVDGSVEVDVFNLVPELTDDSFQVAAGQVLTGNVLDNDSDPNNDTLATSLNNAPVNGAVTLDANGQFTYTPQAGFSGADGFSYSANDGNGGSEIAAVSIEVLPVAAPDTASTPGGEQVCAIDVLANDLGTDLDVIGVTQPADGAVSISGDDTLCFSPDQGFLGASTFSYTVEDAAGTQVDGSVEVDVFNLPPDLANDSFQVAAGQVLEGNVLDNDSDPNGDDLIASLATPPASGSVTLDPDGSFTYTPDAGFSGADGFTYSVDESRARGTSPGAQVEIVVLPVVSDITIEGATDREVAGNLFEGALGTGLSIVDWTAPEVGDLTVNPDGSFTYIAPLGFQGTVQFEFTAEDEYGSRVLGSVSLGFALVHAVPGPGTGGLGLLALLLGWLGLRRLR